VKPKPTRFTGFLRRLGGKRSAGGWVWYAVAEAPSEPEALRLAQRVRYAEPPWAGYSLCEWVGLPEGQHPSEALRRVLGPRKRAAQKPC
jgi:hypothetical protein